MDFTQIAIWIFFIAGLLMTGIIWIIQLVHYPMFHAIDREKFVAEMNRHKTKITFIVAPIMLIEILSGFLMLFNPNDYDYPWEFRIILFVLVLIIWIATFYIQVPAHQKLSKGYKKSIVNALIRSNWLRTGIWTLKSVILSFYLV